jgi:hypothetical protein
MDLPSYIPLNWIARCNRLVRFPSGAQTSHRCSSQHGHRRILLGNISYGFTHPRTIIFGELWVGKSDRHRAYRHFGSGFGRLPSDGEKGELRQVLMWLCLPLLLITASAGQESCDASLVVEAAKFCCNLVHSILHASLVRISPSRLRAISDFCFSSMVRWLK